MPAQRECRAGNTSSEERLPGDDEDAVGPSWSACEHSCSLTMARFEESFFADTGVAAAAAAGEVAADISVDLRSSTISACSSNEDDVVAPGDDASPPFSCANEHARVSCDAGSFELALSEKRPHAGDSTGAVVVAAAASSEESVVARDGVGVLFAPSSDNSLVGLDDGDAIDPVAPAERDVVNDSGKEPDKASAKGPTLGGNGCCAPKESFAGDRASAGTASPSAAASHAEATVPSSRAPRRQVFGQQSETLLRPTEAAAADAAVAETNRSLTGAAAVEKIAKAPEKAGRCVARRRTAGARPGSEKRDVVPRTDPSLRRRLRAVRLRARPPKGWECPPEGLCLKTRAAWLVGGGEAAAAPWLERQEGGKTSG